LSTNSEGRIGSEEQGHRTALGTVLDDDSQLDPRILQESVVGGGWLALERRASVPSFESLIPGAGSRDTLELRPASATSASLSSSTSPSKKSPALPNLQQPQPTSLAPQTQPALRLNNLPRPEISIPDPSVFAGPRSGSASPWPRITNINTTTNTSSANASSSSGGRAGGGNGNGDNSANNNGNFGNSALTYDSFWSGFRGSATPTASTTPTSTAHPTPIAGKHRTGGAGAGSFVSTTGPASGSTFDMAMGVSISMGMGIGQGRAGVVEEGGGSYSLSR